jgi:hypothetical protein
MKISQFFILFLFLKLCFGLDNAAFSQKISKKHTLKKKKIVLKKQVLTSQFCGNVVKLTGNQMPDPDQPAQKKGAAFIGEILIYQLTKMADTEGDGATLFTKINTKLVKKIVSNKSGKFCTNLPMGKYSVFVNEPGYGLFASIFDGEMNVNPIEVIKGKNTNIELQITHSAAF